MNKLKTRFNRKMLSLLMLGCIATSTDSASANFFVDLFTTPSTTDLIFKHLKSATKWSKKQTKSVANYIPAAVVSSLAGALAQYITNKIIEKCVLTPYKKIVAINENIEAINLKNELTNKVNQEPGKEIRIQKKQLGIIVKYAQSLQEKKGLIVDKASLAETLKAIENLQKN